MNDTQNNDNQADQTDQLTDLEPNSEVVVGGNGALLNVSGNNTWVGAVNNRGVLLVGVDSVKL